MRSPLFRIVGVEHLQATNLTLVTMEIRTFFFKVTASGSSVRTQLGQVLVSPSYNGRG